MDQQDVIEPRPVTDATEFLGDFPSPSRSIIAKTIFHYLIGGNRTHRRTVEGKLEDRKAVFATWSSEDRRNVLSFMHVDKCFYKAGRDGLDNIFPNELPRPDWMNANCRILNLPEEVWTKIYKLLGYNKENLLPLWKRASLSVESFASAPPHPHDLDTGHSHIGKFRLVCKRWAELGLKNQFARVQIRFSNRDFPRLRRLARWQHAASNVKQFSYIVPRFYSKDAYQFEEILHHFNVSSTNSQVGERRQPSTESQRRVAEHYRRQIFNAMLKAREQKRIIIEEIDQDALRVAMKAFTHLKQIRVMRVVDPVDGGWAIFLQNNPIYADAHTESEWTAASDHAISTLYAAIRRSGSPFVRFSSRFMEPSMPISLTNSLISQVGGIARQLISIELQFVDDTDPNERLATLSPLFRIFFKAAGHLESFHIGCNRQISVPLAVVFHNVHFENLNHIGLSKWQLDWEDLLKMLERHQRLKSLRLREIVLRRTSLEESNWEKVLRFIRLNLRWLEWLSLRDIGYEDTPTFDGMHPLAPFYQPQHNGSESDLDNDPNDWDSSEVEDDDDSDLGDTPNQPANVHDIQHPLNQDVDIAQDTGSEDEGSDDEAMDEYEGSVRSTTGPGDDDDHHSDLGSVHNETLSAVDAKPGQCACEHGFALDNIGDNGILVTKDQWKRWQIWAMKRCWQHDNARYG
ncbi:hypothetical protein ONS95_013847 [Cadophora gregata]|uniref:uncharacterized protein n=1 Tax=Cadophora gregata TaxID=51156 RepID=UPI0026DB6FB8|nr:uncharacterized protein ONS95_013847 [Cadophora gregata]KAK0113602.1 hypothetical protein ONS96_014457 [Cadophora gregata f. sp. sojae]KAK0114355.1 hypothetical protein ONS95_013847 [Cadophora gregata]